MKITNKFYPWICWVVAASVYFMQYGLWVFPSAITQNLSTSLQINPLQLSVFTSAFMYVYVLMQVPSGLIFDKYASHKILFFACSALIAGCLILGITDNYYVAIFARILMGFGGSFTFVGVLYLGRSWFALSVFPIIVALTESLSGAGALGFYTFFSELSQIVSWRYILLGLAILLALIAILVLTIVRDSQKVQKKDKISALKDLRVCFANKVIWLLALYVGFSFAHYCVMGLMWNIPHFMRHFHVTEAQAIILNSFVIVGFIVGCTIMGYLCQFFNIIKIMLVSIVAQFILISASLITGVDIHQEAGILFLSGILTGASILVFPLSRKVVSAESYGVVTGFINMFFGISAIFMMPLVGYVLKISHYDYDLSYIPILIAVFLAAVIGVILWVKEKEYFPGSAQITNPRDKNEDIG